MWYLCSVGICALCMCAYSTCVLCDLSLGDRLFTFGIHQLTVLVLLQTLQHVLGIRLSTEPLTPSNHRGGVDRHYDRKEQRSISTQHEGVSGGKGYA